MLSKFKYFLPPLIVGAGIFIVSHQPNVSLPNVVMEFNDKFLHAIAYLVFGCSIIFALKNINLGLTRVRLFLFLFMIGTIYSVLDEFHQKLIPGRSFEIADMAADVIGVLISFLLYPYFEKLYYKLSKSNV